MSETKVEEWHIFPGMRVRYSSTGYWLERWQPRGHAWEPIKHWDEAHFNAERIRNIAAWLDDVSRRFAERQS